MPYYKKNLTKKTVKTVKHFEMKNTTNNDVIALLKISSTIILYGFSSSLVYIAMFKSGPSQEYFVRHQSHHVSRTTRGGIQSRAQIGPTTCPVPQRQFVNKKQS